MEHNQIRVVLLEDSEDIRNILHEVLDMRGYEIYSFETPVICPLQLKPDCRCEENERCVDVIITDFYMPLINGLEFIENQKIKGCKAPYVAMMSGGWEEEG
ncbi:MAG: response regulator, partial [Deltaproteobacteria bacterium]|nr:response regulator [Deltaproteobacteria bacterium]